MERRIDRRRFVALAGTAGVVGVAGCSGDDQPPDEGGSSGGGDGDEGGNEQTEEQTEDEEGDNESDDPFDFPPGANENGIVTDTVVPGARQFLEETGRYRVEETHELDPSDASTDELAGTYDVDERLVHQRISKNGVETDRWVTPDRTVAQSVDADADRTGRWQAKTADPTAGSNAEFNSYPFVETTVPSLLRSASFEFDGIVTGKAPDSDESDGSDGSDESNGSDNSDGSDGSDADERAYAQYVGDIPSAEQLELRQPKTARIDYRLESVSEGRISILLAESGAIPLVEYEFAGEATRRTHDSREVIEIETSGEVRFEYGEDLEPVEKPEWVESPDPNQVRRFELTETTLGQTYKLVDGEPLPSFQELEYAEFYLAVELGSERYLIRHLPRAEVDAEARLAAGFEDGELQMGRALFSGRDALAEADRIEMSVYLYAPRKGRMMVYHEERNP